MGWLRRMFGREARACSVEEQIETALREQRAHYAELRASTARCLYRVHQLGREAAHQRRLREAARDMARAALADDNTRRSEHLAARAERARAQASEIERLRTPLRETADAGLAGLRRIGGVIAALEHDRLRALVVASEPVGSSPNLVEARRALDLMEAERELERALR